MFRFTQVAHCQRRLGSTRRLSFHFQGSGAGFTQPARVNVI